MSHILDGVSEHGSEGSGRSEPRPAEQALLEAAERIAGFGSFEWVPETGEMRWTDNLFRIFGLEPGEVPPALDFWRSCVHPDDLEVVEPAVERFQSSGESPEAFEYRFIRPDGALRHLRALGGAVEESGGTRRLIGSIQDVTDQRRAEREIAAHIAVAEVLSDWKTFDSDAVALLQRLATAMGFDAAALWVPEDRVLVPRAVWRSRGLDGSEFESVTGRLRFPRGAGLPGRVWETQRPLTSARSEEEDVFARRGVADLSEAVAFPALHDGEAFAVIELYSRAHPGLTDRSVRSLIGIGYELGRFFSGRRGDLGPVRSLTPREVEVIQLAAYGLSGREIAGQLIVSPSTVKTHFNHIYEKLGVADRAGAVATALRLGLIE